MVFFGRLDELESDHVGQSTVGRDSNGGNGRKCAVLSLFLKECSSRFFSGCKIVVGPIRVVYWFKWRISGGSGHSGLLGCLDCSQL